MEFKMCVLSLLQTLMSASGLSVQVSWKAYGFAGDCRIPYSLDSIAGPVFFEIARKLHE